MLCGGGRKEGMGNNKFIEYTERNDDLGIAHVQGGPQKMQKLTEYPTTKSVNYEFIRA